MPTELPTRYEPAQIERETYAFWTERGFFRADPDRPGEPYTIVIPPPNVTAELHMGHALNNTLQDVFVRYRRMSGRNTLWLPGTDHAGIATQNVVERELAAEGLHRRDLGREEFVERVWQWREQYGSRIIGQLKRLGCSCDWDREPPFRTSRSSTKSTRGTSGTSAIPSRASPSAASPSPPRGRRPCWATPPSPSIPTTSATPT